jgi:hypothetical protein
MSRSTPVVWNRHYSVEAIPDPKKSSHFGNTSEMVVRDRHRSAAGQLRSAYFGIFTSLGDTPHCDP